MNLLLSGQNFENSVLQGHNIEIIENIAYAIDKENPHKKVKLSELVDKDSAIQELLKGRQQKGMQQQALIQKKLTEYLLMFL